MADNERLPTKIEETMDGTVLFDVPFPQGDDLSLLKQMGHILIKQPYYIEYLHSYAQDSPFFAGLANKRFVTNREPETGYTYATPRGHDMYTGRETEWVEITGEGVIHAFTVCHFASEEFLPECPLVLVQVEFLGVDTLFLARLIGVDPDAASTDWIGMKVVPRYRRLSKFKPTDVYFVPGE